MVSGFLISPKDHERIFSGLAIVIFLAQMTQFQTAPAPAGEHHGPFNMLHGTWMSGLTLWLMLGLVALTMALIWATPKITKIILAVCFEPVS